MSSRPRLKLYIRRRVAERGNGRCKICYEKIERDEKHVRVYSAHHSIGFHQRCFMPQMRDMLDKWAHDLVE